MAVLLNEMFVAPVVNDFLGETFSIPCKIFEARFVADPSDFGKALTPALNIVMLFHTGLLAFRGKREATLVETLNQVAIKAAHTFTERFPQFCFTD